jgi:hypothetical protein
LNIPFNKGLFGEGTLREHSGSIQGTNRDKTRSVPFNKGSFREGTCSEQSGREHSGRKHSRNIPGTIREQPGNKQ